LAITLAVLLVALDTLQTSLTRWRVLALFAAAVIAGLLSQAVVFALTAGGGVIALDALVNRRRDRAMRGVVAAGWAVAVGMAVALGFRAMTPVDNAYMHVFWRDSFMPHDLRDGTAWLWATLSGMFSAPANRRITFDGAMHYSWPVAFIVVMAVGIISSLVRNWRTGLLIIGPVVLAFFGGFAHAFPVGIRVTLFLMPLLLINVVLGLVSVGSIISKDYGAAAALAVVPLSVVTVWNEHPPRRPEHLRPVVDYIADHQQPGDAVWVYYGAGQGFALYRRRVTLTADVTFGDCDRIDPRHYLAQIDVERGRSRVWVVAAHGSAAFRYDERGLLIRYLDTIGQRRDYFTPPNDSAAGPAAVWLYDLSSASKLNAASADRFPVAGQFTPIGWNCYGVMTARPDRQPAALVMAVAK
jgi:hypothetical protein